MLMDLFTNELGVKDAGELQKIKNIVDLIR